MTPRRPSSASTDNSPLRIPFATAEALLWGPELRKQQAWLLEQMKALQRQHEAYDARIQTTEASSEAAEAATARIRHMEQQIAAMEAVDDDKLFEKWAGEEIAQLKIFVNSNQTVRQKQVELEKEISDVVDELDIVKDVSSDLRSLRRRLDLLEASRREDANHIKSLEKEIANLKAIRQDLVIKPANSRANVNHKPSSVRARTPPQVPEAEVSDGTTETEDEDRIPPRRPTPDQIQVPRSPEMEQRSSDTMLITSPAKDQPVISARHRLFRRPSIHNSKLSRLDAERQNRAPAPGPGSRPQPTPNPPATQLINRASPTKRKQHEDGLYTQRITRSQAQRQERGSKQPVPVGPSKNKSVKLTQAVTARPTKRRKLNIATAPSKGTPTQLVAASPAKLKKPNMIASSNKKMFVQPVQQDSSQPAKRKQLIVVLPNRPADRQLGENGREHLQLSAADRVKTSPRKVAKTSPATAESTKAKGSAARATPEYPDLDTFLKMIGDGSDV